MSPTPTMECKIVAFGMHCALKTGLLRRGIFTHGTHIHSTIREHPKSYLAGIPYHVHLHVAHSLSMFT